MSDTTTDSADGSEENALMAPPSRATELDAFHALRDVEVEVSLEIGRRRARISDVLRFGVGQTIELDKAVGAPIDIFINGRLLGRGKAIIVNDRYGVRITELVTPGDRS